MQRVFFSFAKWSVLVKLNIVKTVRFFGPPANASHQAIKQCK